MTGKTRAKLSFKYLEYLFAFAQRPQQHCYRTDVQGVSCQPKQVRCDGVEFSQDRTQVMGSRRDCQAHHLFDRLYPNQAVRNGSDVVETIPVWGDHRVHAVLGDLLHATMEIANIAVEIDHGFAVEPQDYAQHTVR